MLGAAATYINENPLIIVFGFFSTLLGTVQLILSAIAWMRNHKEKELLEQKTKTVMEYLNGKAQQDKTSEELEKAKEELETIRKQLEDELPRERRNTILKEQIKCEEMIISQASVEIRRLKNQLEMDEEAPVGGIDTWFRRIKAVLTMPETKEFLMLLLGMEALVYFGGIVAGDIAVRLLGYAGIAVLVFYAVKNYAVLQNDKAKVVMHYLVNIFICLCFIDACLAGSMQGIMWWIILIFVACVKQDVLNLLWDRVIPLLSIALFMTLFVAPNYEDYILLGLLVIQVLLLIINGCKIRKTVKSK